MSDQTAIDLPEDALQRFMVGFCAASPTSRRRVLDIILAEPEPDLEIETDLARLEARMLALGVPADLLDRLKQAMAEINSLESC